MLLGMLLPLESESLGKYSTESEQLPHGLDCGQTKYPE